LAILHAVPKTYYLFWLFFLLFFCFTKEFSAVLKKQQKAITEEKFIAFLKSCNFLPPDGNNNIKDNNHINININK
jgi:hypothetical protein